MIEIDNLSNNELDALATNADVLAQSSINYDEFLNAQLPPRETLLAPWLPRRGLGDDPRAARYR